MIFNSNLFHMTAKGHFRPGYKHRRINITFLYGKRVSKAAATPALSASATPSEDSSAFALDSGFPAQHEDTQSTTEIPHRRRVGDAEWGL